jgi:hypothetical protein
MNIDPTSSIPLVCGLALSCGITTAIARPLAPSSVTVRANSPVQVTVSFFQSPIVVDQYRGLINWEVEKWVNGRRLAHQEEARLSATVNAGMTREQHGNGGPIEFAVPGLRPQTEYCFRIWAREGGGTRSDHPSDRACAVTPPHPPLAPLDAKAQLRTIADRVPTVSWSAPDMSDFRGIDRYTIERQSPPGPNRPWIPEKTVSGGANGGPQSMSVGLAHTTTTGAIDPQQTHVYRICAVNQGGKTCAEPVALERLAPGPQQAAQSGSAARVATAAAPSVDGPLRAPSNATSTTTAPAGDADGGYAARTTSRTALSTRIAVAQPTPTPPAATQPTATPAPPLLPDPSKLGSPIPPGDTSGLLRAPTVLARPSDGLQTTTDVPTQRGSTSAAGTATAAAAAAPAVPATSPPAAVPAAAPRIVLPAPDSRVAAGQLRLQVLPAAGAPPREAQVEFRWVSALPGHTAPPPERHPVQPAWALPLQHLAQGAIVPPAVGPTKSGRWQVRVRALGEPAGPWSTPVAFDFVAAQDLASAGSSPSARARAGERTRPSLEQRSLNPQPLPPKQAQAKGLDRTSQDLERRSLNPQPLPPRSAFNRQPQP